MNSCNQAQMVHVWTWFRWQGEDTGHREESEDDTDPHQETRNNNSNDAERHWVLFNYKINDGFGVFSWPICKIKITPCAEVQCAVCLVVGEKGYGSSECEWSWRWKMEKCQFKPIAPPTGLENRECQKFTLSFSCIFTHTSPHRSWIMFYILFIATC